MPTAAVDATTTRMRHAGRDLLSLGLIDARNHTLRWAAAFEAASVSAKRPNRSSATPDRATESPFWLIGHIGWMQEHWIARNVQRQRGAACDPTAPRLTSIEPDADRLYDPALLGGSFSSRTTGGDNHIVDLPDLQSTRLYLADTIDVTLELLESAEDDDDGLYFFRMALLREDLFCEALARIAQTSGIAIGPESKLLVADIASSVIRPPLSFPATRCTIGSAPGGFAFDNERSAHEVDLPEFEIDSQPVSWSQYAEFALDGGYDDRQWWSPAGWQWVESVGRRVPRHVDQMRGAVLQQRFGHLTRVPMNQPAMHVALHEAEAWCRWAGRRLPTEVEWEHAAIAGRSRGFRFGDVWEWTASTFQPYAGFRMDPDRQYSMAGFGRMKALRGASFAAHRRLVDPRFRQFAEGGRDDLFVGFRSCAV